MSYKTGTLINVDIRLISLMQVPGKVVLPPRRD